MLKEKINEVALYKILVNEYIEISVITL